MEDSHTKVAKVHNGKVRDEFGNQASMKTGDYRAAHLLKIGAWCFSGAWSFGAPKAPWLTFCLENALDSKSPIVVQRGRVSHCPQNI
jgi:hypothetical protein